VGFKVADLIARQLGIRFKRSPFKSYLIARNVTPTLNEKLYVVKPLTHMNRSGLIIKELLKRTSLSVNELLVVYDTLDLSPGICRLKKKGSAAGHKGLTSIIEHLGSNNFLRLSIGIGRPKVQGRIEDYVLAAPRKKEALVLAEAIVRSAESILRLLEEEPEKVMNDLNRKER
jgi:PTH1 family peptidyl-tRNA hydrolase